VTVIQIETYDLKSSSTQGDVTRFLELDARLQTEVVYHLRGLERRTTARSESGWVTITLWDSSEPALEGQVIIDAHPLEVERRSLMTSLSTNSYFTTI
jgi:hypothetical protein